MAATTASGIQGRRLSPCRRACAAAGCRFMPLARADPAPRVPARSGIELGRRRTGSSDEPSPRRRPDRRGASRRRSRSWRDLSRRAARRLRRSPPAAPSCPGGRAQACRVPGLLPAVPRIGEHDIGRVEHLYQRGSPAARTCALRRRRRARQDDVPHCRAPVDRKYDLGVPATGERAHGGADASHRFPVTLPPVQGEQDAAPVCPRHRRAKQAGSVHRPLQCVDHRVAGDEHLLLGNGLQEQVRRTPRGRAEVE